MEGGGRWRGDCAETSRSCRGQATLNITDDIDKVRFGRVRPLTEEARAALDAVCPDSGLIFGDRDYRDQLRKAANAVLDVQRAKTFTAYGLCHHRLTEPH